MKFHPAILPFHEIPQVYLPKKRRRPATHHLAKQRFDAVGWEIPVHAARVVLDEHFESAESFEALVHFIAASRQFGRVVGIDDGVTMLCDDVDDSCLSRAKRSGTVVAHDESGRFEMNRYHA